MRNHQGQQLLLRHLVAVVAVVVVGIDRHHHVHATPIDLLVDGVEVVVAVEEVVIAVVVVAAAAAAAVAAE